MFGKKEILIQLASIEAREMRHHVETLEVIDALSMRLDAICEALVCEALDRIKAKDNPCDYIPTQNDLHMLNLRINHALSNPGGK